MARQDWQLVAAGGISGAGNSAAVSFDRLLVPVDFSSASRCAMELAILVARSSGSEIVLFHAARSDENDQFLARTGGSWGRSDVVGQAHDHLRRFAEAVVPGSGERVRIEAERDDNPVKAVARACVRHATSVVVLGTHTHPKRRWRRSLTEQIVREVGCTVVLVQGEREAYMDADS
jgi:nucleotide-binding universal stress UspA family protein